LHGYWASLPSLVPVLGVERALELAEAGEQIIPGIRAWAAAREEDVWLREAGMLEVSAAPAQDGTVEKAAAAAARVGRPDHAVALATNAALTGWSPASRSLTNFGSYVVLTEPAPEQLAEIGWTGGEAIVDGRMFLHYFRTTNDGRVLMGSGSGPIGFGGRVDDRFVHDLPTAGRAERGLRRLLPGLAAARVERAWGGPIDVSADHLPFVGTVPGTNIHYGL